MKMRVHPHHSNKEIDAHGRSFFISLCILRITEYRFCLRKSLINPGHGRIHYALDFKMFASVVIVRCRINVTIECPCVRERDPRRRPQTSTSTMEVNVLENVFIPVRTAPF
jgi:hypothetical protein